MLGSIFTDRTSWRPLTTTLIMPPPDWPSTVISASFSCAATILACISWACFNIFLKFMVHFPCYYIELLCSTFTLDPRLRGDDLLNRFDHRAGECFQGFGHQWVVLYVFNFLLLLLVFLLLQRRFCVGSAVAFNQPSFTGPYL